MGREEGGTGSSGSSPDVHLEGKSHASAVTVGLCRAPVATDSLKTVSIDIK